MTSPTLLAPRPARDLALVPAPRPVPGAPVAPSGGRRAVIGLHGPADTSTAVLTSVLLATG